MGEAVEKIKRVYRWVPLERDRARLSRDSLFVLFRIDGKLYSLRVEDLFDLISGYSMDIEISRLVDQ
jgi:hypothetical protein